MSINLFSPSKRSTHIIVAFYLLFVIAFIFVEPPFAFPSTFGATFFGILFLYAFAEVTGWLFRHLKGNPNKDNTHP